VSRSIRDDAEDYVRCLDVGSDIGPEDATVIAPFRHLIAGLLYKRRLYLVRRGDREIVTRRPPWAASIPNWMLARLMGYEATARENRIVCRKCSTPFFDCEHEAQLIVAGVVEPVMPWIGSIQPRACA